MDFEHGYTQLLVCRLAPDSLYIFQIASPVFDLGIDPLGLAKVAVFSRIITHLMAINHHQACVWVDLLAAAAQKFFHLQ